MKETNFSAGFMTPSTAIVGGETGEILFKCDNGQTYFKSGFKTIKDNNIKKFPHTLKWILDNKEKTGLDLIADVSNYTERYEYEYSQLHTIFPLGRDSFNFWGGDEGITAPFTATYSKFRSGIKEIHWMEMAIKDQTGGWGNPTIIIECCLDEKNWQEYASFKRSEMRGVDYGGKGGDSYIRINKKIECPNRTFRYRFKFAGSGAVGCKEDDPWWFGAGGVTIIDEKYIPEPDETLNIPMKKITTENIEFDRSLLHPIGFENDDKFEQINSRKTRRNSRQNIKLYLVGAGNLKIKIFDEVYTDGFIDKLFLEKALEEKYLLFNKDDVESPTIEINAKTKQLLFKNDKGHYINKSIIPRRTNFNNFGFKSYKNISFYSKEGNLLDNKILLPKIKVLNAKNLSFGGIQIGTENMVDTLILDANNKHIFTGLLFVSETMDFNESEIIEKIKKCKTFYKGSIILYNEINEEIKKFINAISACKRTPETIVLACTNPNSSNINQAIIDKTTVGSKAFKELLTNAIKSKIGLQFASPLVALDEIVDEQSRQISSGGTIPVHNLVGFNIYNFTGNKMNIPVDLMNKYGGYINEVVDVIKHTNKIEYVNSSKNNSLKDIVQYDIGTKFELNFDLSDSIATLNRELLTEDGNFGKDKPYYSISVCHGVNVLYKYIVGRDEIEVIKNEEMASKYTIGMNGGVIKVKFNEELDLKYRGMNELVVIVKKNDAVITSEIANFLVDYAEPSIEKFYMNTADAVNEKDYGGSSEKPYTKDNFFEVGLNLNSEYNFLPGEYKIQICHKNNNDYKIERELTGVLKSKIFTFSIDSIKNDKDLKEKIKFGDWECKLIRKKFSVSLKNTELNIPFNLQSALNISAVPTDPDFEDFMNDGLQQGKDLEIRMKFANSDYFKTVRDSIRFIKEVRFISNNVNLTTKPEYFTYLDESGTNSNHSLNFITQHQAALPLDKRNELKWFISGKSESDSNKFLDTIANLAGLSKRVKNIKIQLVLFTGEIIETPVVTIGTEGKVSTPILLGSTEHKDKLLAVEAKTLKKSSDKLTEAEKNKIIEKWKALGKSNYDRQQYVNDSLVFSYYSNLIEMHLDFGIAEYYTVSQANNTTDMIPVTRNGVIRYVLDEDGIDEFGKGIITIKGYIKLADGTINSSNEIAIPFYRKRFPSLVTTGEDYTKYVFYENQKDHYVALKTVIQSHLKLENLENTYDSSRIDHIKVELVDVDKRTVIAEGPIVKFYDGFIPQRFIFDNGLSEDDHKKLDKEDRVSIEQTKQYKELEKILNEKIFKQGRQLGQTFYLRFKAIEKVKNAYDKVVEINGKETFYPVLFIEKLKELQIIPSDGIIVMEDGGEEKLYTYNNKIAFMLESNNVEYFMYRTDRAASFQKVYPKSVGYSKILKIVVSTYDVGNHFLEVKQKAEGETESNVYSVIVEKIKPTSPPKLTGDILVDENCTWVLHPVSEAVTVETSITSNDREHSKKKSRALPYESYINSDAFLEIGYHTVKAVAYDKIGNGSEPSYFITKKIGRPVTSVLEGNVKTSENFIKWSWQSQYFEGIKEYQVEVNGIEKYIIPASRDGINEYTMRFFQGKPIADGLYELRVWAINELGNKNYMYSSFVTEKGTKISQLAIDFYRYKEEYTNKLEAKIITNDSAIKEIEYEIFRNEDGKVISETGLMKSAQKELPFVTSEGEIVNLKDGQYYFAFRGVNFIGEKTDYIKIPFIFKKNLPQKPFIYYQRIVNSTTPLIFIKQNGNEPILSTEIKIGDKPFEIMKNQVWRPNYSLPTGVNNIIVRMTDYAGNQSEFSDFIEISSKGVNLFQDNVIVDMKNPILKLDFHLQEMTNYGYDKFKIENETLGISTMVDTINANNIEIPLTYSQGEIYPNGVYTFVVKLPDRVTGEFDYIAQFFTVKIDNTAPMKPYFLNSGYDEEEYDKFYTKNRQPKWLWQTKQKIEEVKEYKISLLEYSDKENKFLDYGIGQFKDYSTKLVGQFQVPGDLKDGIYRLAVRTVSLNNLESDSSTFTFVIKNKSPKPPKFDLDDPINRKYENRNQGIMWKWIDINNGNDEFVAYKIKINDGEFTSEFPANKNYYIEPRKLNDGPNRIVVIGKDKAENWSTANETEAAALGVEYMSNTKILDTSNPEKLTDKDLKVIINNSGSFDILFDGELKKDEYLSFKLYTDTSDRGLVTFAEGNTLAKTTTEKIYFGEEIVKGGIVSGELKDNTGYCEILTSETENYINKSLHFENLLPNIYYVEIVVTDFAGNISQSIIKEIELKDLTTIKPVFISPKNLFTNNSTLVFQWILNAENIEKWEYQLVTPYNKSAVDLIDWTKWKTLEENTFKLNNIPRTIAGNKADGDYTLYVRAIFKERVKQAETGVEVNKRSDISSITVKLDREIPMGITFTNKGYTTDNGVLRWNWEYTGKGDTVNGVYWSFNPNLPIEEWTKLEKVKELSLFQDREDGIYTIYMKTFDMAGNINNTIFENSIVLDRKPPFKPIILGGTHIYTNKIPTISWENDINYFRYSWLVLKKQDFMKFKETYDKLINVQNYTLTNDDWKYIFSTETIKGKVSSELENLGIKFIKNDYIIDNFVTINKTATKNGIQDEGEYVFMLSGYDPNGNWAEDFEYQFITYDISAPDLDKIYFISPVYVITDNRRPQWQWKTPQDVIRCEYYLEKNGHSDGSVSGTIDKSENVQSEITYNFKPNFNLTNGNYRLVVTCYDAAGNSVQINKSVIIETENSTLETEFKDIILEGVNNRIRIRKNKYSDVYVISDIDIDKNSVLSYRALNSSTKTEFKIYELGKTELSMNEEYEFNIISYDLDIN